MRISLKNKILKIWVDNGLIKNESLSKNPSGLWNTAVDFADFIAKTDGEESEKLYFANTITKIHEGVMKWKKQ